MRTLELFMSTLAALVFSATMSFAADPIACALCGQRLLHDIAIDSPSLKSSVAQARAKYDHCIRGAAAACPESCWQTRLADPLAGCASHEGMSYRACVAKLKQDASEICESGG